MTEYPTVTIGRRLAQCDSIEELKGEILPKLTDQRSQWKEKIQKIVENTGYSYTQFAKLCGVSKPAVDKWLAGAFPQRRDMYLRIGFAAGYSLEEMNDFLKRYGRCPQLYVKSLEDIVCIFILKSQKLEHTYATYKNLLDLVQKEYEAAGTVSAATVVTYYPTAVVDQGFQTVDDLESMVRFVQEHTAVYRESYQRLYKYIIAYLMINLQSEHLSERDRRPSIHQLADAGNWSSSLRHCVSDILNKKWFPKRDKLISLGLHLNMDDAAINEMLRLAQMQPLYAQNPIEASILWAINEAKLVADGGDIAGGEILEDLSQFVKDILIQLDLSDSASLIDDL